MQVALICMPTSPIEKPSIGVSILKESLRIVDIECKVFYGNLSFAKLLGTYDYQRLCNISTELNVVEWLFYNAAFPHSDLGDKAFLARIEKSHRINADWLLGLRRYVTPFIKQMAEDILVAKPQAVGCSTMFCQNCSSIALLREIKQRSPSTKTFMGGANVEGNMGLTMHKKLDFIDYVFLGEGDETLPEAMVEIIDSGQLSPRKFILTPDDREVGYVDCDLKSARVKDMTKVRAPDYHDYFQQLHDLELDKLVSPCIMMETSRGCWWGDRRPCTFCSLNGTSNRYRTKDMEKISYELEYQTLEYGITNYHLVDNVIGKEQLNNFIPYLIENKNNFNLLYEVKPILNKRTIEDLVKAGVHWVQAGIENLNDHVLSILNKGSTSLQNIGFLRNALNAGLGVLWNYMTDIPMTTQKDIDEVVRIIPLLSHLQPPYFAPLRYDRFSDYYNRQSHYKLNLIPYWTYKHVYPFNEEELMDFAFFFENTKQLDAVDHSQLINAIYNWSIIYYEGYFKRDTVETTPVLDYYYDEDKLIIEDTRPCRTKEKHILEGKCKTLYENCAIPCTLIKLKELMIKVDGNSVDIEKELERLVKHGLLIHRDNKYLSLAVSKYRKPLPHSSAFPGGKVSYEQSNDYFSLFKQ